MDLGIAGKVAFVTGGSQGLGLSVARSLVEEGVIVVIIARNEERARAAAAGLAGPGREIHVITADVTSAEQVERLFASAADRNLSPDILVYNTSGPPRQSFLDSPDEDYARANEELVLGFARMARGAFEHMSKRRWGRIITLGSLAVKEPHVGGKALHNVYRMAAVGLSKTLSDDFGPFGVTVNTIGTGMIYEGVESGGWRRVVDAAAENGVSVDEEVARRSSMLAVRRFGRADEMGGLCAFLCSQQGGFVTGQTIMLDGGQTRAVL